MRIATFLLVLFIGCLLAVVSRAAPNFELLLSFNGTNGANPISPMVQGNDGEFYGTTAPYGGQWNAGTIFKLGRSSHLTTLFSFDVTNGAGPESGLIRGGDGNFYGTTTFGGFEDEDGAIYRITPDGQFDYLFFFDGADGGEPNGLLLGKDGNLYGTTQWGYSTNGIENYGTVFKFDLTDGDLTVLHQFSGNDGWEPVEPLARDEEGNLYGTTEWGGGLQAGSVFKMAPDGTLIWSFAFDGTNGLTPIGKLVEGSDGNFYGLTVYGSPELLQAGGGTVFRITPDGVLTTIYAFGQFEYYANPNSSGSGPTSLILGRDGCLYGATMSGGTNGAGTIFRVTTNGILTTLYSFGTLTNAYGYPLDGNEMKYLVQDDRTGEFYGTSFGGG
jgi:uncharacterized repeat protein (TIGR03803 family)